MVELYPKARKKKYSAISPQHSAKTNSKAKTIFTAEDAEGAKENPAWVGQSHANLGCGGVRREG
jgi:hypothetical protein